jgi:selenocysteine lyase/cysteine desulfurase
MVRSLDRAHREPLRPPKVGSVATDSAGAHVTPQTAPLPTFDLSFARAQFPAYDDGNPLGELAFFEAAGGSFPCRSVVDRITRLYTTAKLQPGYPTGPSTGAWDEMQQTYARLADWMGVTADEVVIGPSTTQNIYVLANAARDILGPGDAVVITDGAHESNAGSWARLADAGVEVRIWPIDPETGSLTVEALRAVIDKDVAIVAFPEVSNLIGEPIDVAAVCAVIREAGAMSIVDGVAAAPHGLPWIDDLGCDIYLFSTYKTFGPHQGVMVVRTDTMAQLPNQGHYFNADQPHKRLVPAGPDHVQVAALQGVVDYLEAIDEHHFDTPATGRARAVRVHDLLRAAEAELMAPLMAFLTAREDVTVLGPSDPSVRVPTVAVRLDRVAADVTKQLGERGVAAANGHFYSHRVTLAMGVNPERVLRLSFTHTTAPWEIERVIAELTAILDTPA